MSRGKTSYIFDKTVGTSFTWVAADKHAKRISNPACSTIKKRTRIEIIKTISIPTTTFHFIIGDAT